MSLARFISFCFLAALTATIIGCAGSGKLLMDETYSALKPIKQLELPEQIENNLVVKISNVADEASSYKNRLELYLNNRLIEPNWLVSNVQNTFIYKMKLKPGYYEVKAFYYAYVGWGDEKFRIESQELVRVTPTTRTILTCPITKKPNGVPVNKKMYFKVKTELLIPPPKAESKIQSEQVQPKPDNAEVVKPNNSKKKVRIHKHRRRPKFF